ncbi:class I SAM-dependent methyltransferase [Jatrophihabitans sp. YIM 134969]
MTVAEMSRFQDQAHGEDHDYDIGSPHLTHPQLRSEIVRRLRGLVAERVAATGSARVLEIGAGHGSFTDHLLAFGAEVTATEMSAASAEHLQARYAANPRARVVHDPDGDAASALGERFDLVVAASVLHHIPDYLAAVRTWADVTAPGGTFFSVADPLLYSEVGTWAHRLQWGAHYAWRLGQPGQLAAARNLLRRTRRGVDETQESDMVEYHVLRDGVDHVSLTAQLREDFPDVELWRYWSTPSPTFQALGERAGLQTNFAVTARGRRG